MISRMEFLGYAAALAMSSNAGAQQATSAAEREAAARKNTTYKSGKIMAMDQASLVGILQDSKASDFEKAKACQRIAVVGDETAAPALAALLPNPRLSHYARYALEPIPGPQVDEVLRGALGRLNGDLRIGVINSIGRRKDARALDALARLRRDPDQATADAASAAIAEIRRP